MTDKPDISTDEMLASIRSIISTPEPTQISAVRTIATWEPLAPAPTTFETKLKRYEAELGRTAFGRGLPTDARAALLAHVASLEMHLDGARGCLAEQTARAERAETALHEANVLIGKQSVDIDNLKAALAEARNALARIQVEPQNTMSDAKAVQNMRGIAIDAMNKTKAAAPKQGDVT